MLLDRFSVGMGIPQRYTFVFYRGVDMSRCRLCEDPSTLIDSHLIPKSAYKASKSFVSGERRELVSVKMSNGSAAYSDAQVTMKLLCKSCEDLFSKNGEKILGRKWATASGFPLLDELRSLEPLAKGPKFVVYDAAAVDRATLNALFYFAISIFWRASVWRWGRDQDRYVGALGVKYEARFRDFLLGRGSLENVYMIISVNDSDNLNGLIAFPCVNKSAGVRVHVFDVLGIKFTIFVGGHIPSEIMKPFLASGSRVVVISSRLEESNDFLELARALQTKVTARGRLLKETIGTGSA